MDFSELFALLRRRWAVLIPMLALTVAGIGGAWFKIHTQYESQAQVTMINAPKIIHQPGNDGNPYLAFDGTLNVDVDFLARNLTSGASEQQLAALGVTEGYTASIAVNALGPFMLLTVTGPNKEHVSHSIQVLISFAEQHWNQLQQATDAPKNSIIGLSEIAPPGTPTPVLKRKIQAVAGVAIAGLILTVLMTVLADSFIRRRTVRRRVVDADGFIPSRGRRHRTEPAGNGMTRSEPIQQRSPLR